jgi:preprotein translocase subunit SecY
MLSNALRKFKTIFTDPVIRNRLLFVVAAFAVFRFLAAVPIPGVDQVALASFLNNNQYLGLLNIFSGGGLSNLSIVMLGVGPYITASIIMQLGTVIFPKVKAMYSEEGEQGRTRFMSISRMIAVPLSFLQGVAFLTLLESQRIVTTLTPFDFVVNVILIAAGSMLLMWIGELITEFGIGNGVSLIIFAGIVASLPAGISQALFTASAANIPAYVGFALLAVLVILAVVLVSEAERSIPIHYARQVRGNMGAPTYLPVRLLQAGVIPIIFALSLLLLPQMALSALSAIGVTGMAQATAAYAAFSANPWQHGAVYFVLVVMFTYFYTSITFEPKRVADNLQKTGAFIPGVRPGPETERHIGNIVTRITLPGALFLGLVAVIPFIVQGLTGITAILVGGTALLIAVNVVLDLIRKVDAQASLREY